jgi:hypothetical protein
MEGVLDEESLQRVGRVELGIGKRGKGGTRVEGRRLAKRVPKRNLRRKPNEAKSQKKRANQQQKTPRANRDEIRTEGEKPLKNLPATASVGPFRATRS